MSRKRPKNVLLVEDNPGDARLLHEMFNEQLSRDFELTHVQSMTEAEEHLVEHTIDIVLLDLGLPDAQGLTAILRVRAAAPCASLVVLTGLDDELLAARALQEGAQDYLIKGQIETRGLLRTLRYASERKRMEQLKDEFVSTVSHELRTPLTSIVGSLGLLMGKEGGNLTDPATRLLAIAYANSQRLVRLVDDILDIEKMDSGRVVFNIEPVDVRSLVEQTIEAQRSFAEGHGVRILLEAERTVGKVHADFYRLTQVVTNLLSNAIKFSPAGGEVVLAIETSNADMMRISVRDRGSGVPIEFKSRIFERFAQADATNARQKGGTGLGLSIVKQIVERLGGQVGFNDGPGGGSIFFVDLHRVDIISHGDAVLAPEVHDARTVQGEDATNTARPTSVRILHVDDEPDIREIVELALGLDPRFLVRSCASGADALTLAAAWSPDMILCDVMMPVMDGPATLVALRECSQTRHIPVVFMTARAQSRDLEHFQALGASGVITKPFDPTALATSVSRHFQSSAPMATLGESTRRMQAETATLTTQHV